VPAVSPQVVEPIPAVTPCYWPHPRG